MKSPKTQRKPPSATAEFAFGRLACVSPADAADLRRLVRQLDDGADPDPLELERAVRSRTTAVFVLKHNTRIVASATAVRFRTPTGRHCRIEDVVVDERFRGKGLGRRIMTETLHELRRLGVASVELTSRPSRVAANALYRSLGFALRETNVYCFSMKKESRPRVSVARGRPS